MCLSLAAVMMGLASIGCGSGDFAPPPPPELIAAERGGSPGNGPGTIVAKPDSPGAATSGSKSVAVIFNPDLDPEELKLEANQARVQAGYDHIRLHMPITGEELESSSAAKPAAATRSQAVLVREALARNPHPQAIIVEPANPNDKDLAKAIQEARAAKVPVILVSRPLSAGTGTEGTASGPPPILVRPRPFDDSARQLVAAAIRNAKNAKLNPEAGAILLINSAGDTLLPDRVAAVRAALEAAGIHAIQEVRFVRDNQSAQSLLAERLKADPKPTLVFTFDFAATTGSNSVAGEIASGRPFIQAGYTSEENLLRMATAGEFAALAHYAPSRLIRRAITAAVASAQKQEVASPVEIAIVVHESPPDSTAPHLQAEMKSRTKQGRGRP
jgi:ABC-type sugar transport system substrate-binding protein